MKKPYRHLSVVKIAPMSENPRQAESPVEGDWEHFGRPMWDGRPAAWLGVLVAERPFRMPC